jgi:hypothetical protein
MSIIPFILSFICIAFVLGTWTWAFVVFRKIPKTGFWILFSNFALLAIYSLLFILELKSSSGWDEFGIALIWLFVTGGHTFVLLILTIVFRNTHKKR